VDLRRGGFLPRLRSACSVVGMSRRAKWRNGGNGRAQKGENLIELITGKPGSGKTFLAVQRMLEIEPGQRVIYHNVRGLKPEAFSEPSFVRSIPVEETEKFLTKEYQEEISQAIKEKYNRSMLVVIDEAHEYFGEKTISRNNWMAWHRHLGQDVWLITQDAKRIHICYSVLAEYEIRAIKSVFHKGLMYQYRVGGETFKTMRKKKDPRIFDAYESFQVQEVAKPKFHLAYWCAGGIVLAAALFYLLHNSFGGAKPVQAASVRAPVRRPVDGQKVEPPKGKWESISYRGRMGDRISVEYEGRLCELSEVVGEKYAIIEAGRVRCTVVTGKGERTIERGRTVAVGGNGGHAN